MRLDRLQKLLNILVSLATLVAMVAGGLFALLEYLEYRQEGRVRQSLELVKQFNDERLAAQKAKTDDAWDHSQPQLVALFARDRSAAAYAQFVMTLVEEKALRHAISLQFDFYEQTVTCVNAKLCDQSTLDDYFLHSGKRFFNKFYPYICAQRRRWNDPSLWRKVQAYYNPGSMGRLCQGAG